MNPNSVIQIHTDYYNQICYSAQSPDPWKADDTTNMFVDRSVDDVKSVIYARLDLVAAQAEELESAAVADPLIFKAMLDHHITLIRKFRDEINSM